MTSPVESAEAGRGVASTLRIDHVLCYCRARTIEDQLDRYRAAGFDPAERTMRHYPGLRNGFLRLGPEYIEILWVEDEAAFSKAEPVRTAHRAAGRPFGIGLRTSDAEALHREWSARGMELPPIHHGRSVDGAASGAPVWTFLDVPDPLTPGAVCFAITYHDPAGSAGDSPRRKKAPENAIYALAGVRFVSSEAEARARRWAALLASGEVAREPSGWAVRLGPHTLRWTGPGTFEQIFQQPWLEGPRSGGEIALVDVWSHDLGRTEAQARAAGRAVHRVDARWGDGRGEGLWISPDPNDGLALCVHERPFDDWMAERGATTGEEIARR